MSDGGTCPACVSGYPEQCSKTLNDGTLCDAYAQRTPFTGWLKPVTVEFTAVDVDPAVLGILTGGAMGTPPEPEFSMHITRPAYPVRRRAWRVVWEWLTRTPRKYHPASSIYFPAVRLMREEENDG